MIRPARPVRIGAAALGVAGAIALVGCSASTDATTDTSSGVTTDTSTDDSAGTSNGASAGAYADGTYTATGSYQTPESVEQVEVTITLDDGVITAVEVVGDPTRRESEEYQAQFIGGISDAVVGRSLDEISVSRVAGSSLTSGGFNQAVDEIKAEAAAG